MDTITRLNPPELPANPGLFAGARLEDVVSWSISLVQGQSLPDAFAGFQRVWGRRPDPPAVSVAFVSGLANPRFLVEVSAIAAVSVKT